MGTLIKHCLIEMLNRIVDPQINCKCRELPDDALLNEDVATYRVDAFRG